jgi:hypothetical protein
MIMLLVLAVVQSTAPTLDGTLSPGEWKDAARLTGSGSLEILVRPTDSVVYLAVRGPGDGFPHVAVVRGDTVRLLHASAALGTASFAGAGARKLAIATFAFAVRSPGMSGADLAQRDSFYLREGWVATTVRMGRPGETEFKISRSMLPPGSRIAVAYWSSESGVSHWPVALNDASAEDRIVQGFLPEVAEFHPAMWGTID